MPFGSYQTFVRCERNFPFFFRATTVNTQISRKSGKGQDAFADDFILMVGVRVNVTVGKPKMPCPSIISVRLPIAIEDAFPSADQ